MKGAVYQISYLINNVNFANLDYLAGILSIPGDLLRRSSSIS
jgi:hypothetical protein